MKKDFMWMVVILVAMIFASCGTESGNLKKGPGITVTAIADTSIIAETPLTAPRYACGTGKRLKYDKYLGSDLKWVSVSDTESVFLSDDSLSKIGYIYRPRIVSPESSSYDSNIFNSGFFAKFLECLLILAIIVLIVWWLYLWRFNQTRRPTVTTPAVTAPEVQAPVASTPSSPASTTSEVVQQPVNPSHQEIVSHLKDLMKTMQDTGTTELDYTTHGHEVHLKNSGKRGSEKQKKEEDGSAPVAPAPSSQAAATEEKK